MRRSARWPPFKTMRCSAGMRWPTSLQVRIMFKTFWSRWILLGPDRFRLFYCLDFLSGRSWFCRRDLILFVLGSIDPSSEAIALVRELGPAFTGLLVTGRCATGIASELGSMLVTEQVDAMRAMGTDPNRKLVVPRVLASLLMLPLLTAIMDFIGLLGGCVASVLSLRLSAIEFWRRAIDALDFADLMQGFSKPIVFGFILATIGCYKGLTVRGGTQGVGRATTQAAVLGSILIIVADAFLTKIALFLADKVF